MNTDCRACGHNINKHSPGGCIHRHDEPGTPSLDGEFCNCRHSPDEIALRMNKELREEVTGLRRLLGWEDRS